MNKTQVQFILKNLEFTPKKSLGQNFLINTAVLDHILNFSDLSKKDIVLEIGAGLGALTEKLLEKCQKVYAYEIDNVLYKNLLKNLSIFNNLRLFNKDILDGKPPLCNKVISNIPYTITGQIFQKVFFHPNPPEGVLLIEKVIAERIFSTNEYKKFSRITITVNSFLDPITMIDISPESFYPCPKIKLSLIKLKPKKKNHDFLKKEHTIKFYLKFIAGIMPYKNKNIGNAIELFLKSIKKTQITKTEIIDTLKKNNFKNDKITKFEIHNFPELSQIIYNLIKYA
ncbi:MAG: ribosomal RNA small subunit methyltransferase A [Candidatus Lokiarchaeota archaeon]|nr:ribosomal RNA small subunit methyltransferase A [Candidatus Lokiarchaeota archaeon]